MPHAGVVALVFLLLLPSVVPNSNLKEGTTEETVPLLNGCATMELATVALEFLALLRTPKLAHNDIWDIALSLHAVVAKVVGVTEANTIVNKQCKATQGPQMEGPHRVNLGWNSVSDGQPTGRAASDERSALMLLYTMTNGPDWSQNAGWGGEDSVCSWFGVGCSQVSSTAYAVSSLQLVNNGLRGALPSSLIQDLPSLETLVLHRNALAGSVPSLWGSASSRLQELALGMNALTGTLPTEMGKLSSMLWLDLSQNSLSGSLPTEWGALTSLAEVVLDGNALSGALPTEWASMTSLQRMHMVSNALSGTLPTQWASLTSLHWMVLPENALRGSLPTEWASMTLLQQLIFAGNTLSGTLPTQWASLTSLQWLILQDNALTGSLPTQWGTALTWFLGFNLDNNEALSGRLPTEWASMTLLQQLFLHGCTLSGTLPTQWASLTSLQWMNLQDNALTGSLPTQWSALTSLLGVNLNNNKALSGRLPTEWASMTSLQQLFSHGCTLSGTLPTQWASLTALQSMNFQNNALTGSLPTQWSALTLLRVNVGNNKALSGRLPTEWMSMTSLQQLFSHGCTLSGTLPTQWASLTSMKDLLLEGNALTGSLPTEWGTLTTLQVVDLSRNELSGTLPTEWASMTSLQGFAASQMWLSGTLPTEWASLHSLFQLSASLNVLSGTLPTQWATLTSLNFLLVGENALSGSLPTEWGSLTSLLQLYLMDNTLTGALPTEWSRLPSIGSFELVGNALSGTLPTEWASLQSLIAPNLADNAFSGSLPTTWASLSACRNLVLDRNLFSGSLPTEWALLHSIFWISISSNRLSGTLPTEWASLSSIYMLWINDNALSGTLPTQWASLTMPVMLMDANAFTGLLPTQWCFSNLALGSNLLTGAVPTEWARCTALETLSIANNLLTGSLPTQWKGHILLESLDLSNNALTGSLPTQWGSFVALRGLHLQNNMLTGPISSASTAWNSLTNMDVTDNRITAIIDLPLNLVELRASNNQISGALPQSLAHSPHLRRLNFARNPLTASSFPLLIQDLVMRGNHLVCPPPAGLTECVPLETLDLSNSGISGSIPGFLPMLSGEVLLANCRQLSGTLPMTGGSLIGTEPSNTGSRVLQQGALPRPLRHLDLSGAVGLRGAISDWLITESLRFLNLSGTHLKMQRAAVNTFENSSIRVASSRDEALRPGASMAAGCSLVQTAWGGRVIIEPTYYLWTKCVCRAGDAGVDALCHECPSGGSCPGGNGALLVQAGFWCDTEAFQTGRVVSECQMCAPGYCCTGPEPCQLADQCVGNREGVLCGDCLANHSATIGGSGCVSEENGCAGVRWLIPVLCLGSGAFVTVVVTRFKPLQAPETGLKGSLALVIDSFDVLVLFYQIAPLVVTNLDFKKGLGGFLAVLMGVFNLDPNAFGGGDSDGGICFLPGMTSVTRSVTSYGVPLFLLGWTTVIAGGNFVRYRLRQRSEGNAKREPSGELPVMTSPEAPCRWGQGVTEAVLLSFDLTYSTLLKTTFALLSCVEVEGRGPRLLIAGGVECFTSWQLGLIPIIIFLALAPAGFAFWLSHYVRVHEFVGSAVEKKVALFSDHRHLWPAFSYVERFVLILLNSFVPFRNRAQVLFFFVLQVLIIHGVAKPYRDLRHHILDIFSVVMLVCLASLNTSAGLYILENIIDTVATGSLAIAGAIFLVLPSVMPLALCFLKIDPSPNNQTMASKNEAELHEVVSYEDAELEEVVSYASDAVHHWNGDEHPDGAAKWTLC